MSLLRSHDGLRRAPLRRVVAGEEMASLVFHERGFHRVTDFGRVPTARREPARRWRMR
jgi:hypothetical protein